MHASTDNEGSDVDVEVGKPEGGGEEVRSYYAVHLVVYDATKRTGADRVMTEAK